MRPKTPPINALHDARERRVGLDVFLANRGVSLDAHHLVHPPRVIRNGRNNWNFSWTEFGATHAGLLRSLIVTCRAHGIDVSTCLVIVLRRIVQHPPSRVADLAARAWYLHFVANPACAQPYVPSSRRVGFARCEASTYRVLAHDLFTLWTVRMPWHTSRVTARSAGSGQADRRNVRADRG